MPQSLQCPRCNQAVTVGDQAAGQRVKCPHCEQTFLAPGIAASEKDDDDWLQLDGNPPGDSADQTSKAPVPPNAVPPKQAKPKNPKLSPDDQAVLADFTSELDDFTAEIETPPPPAGVPPPSTGGDVFRGLPPTAAGAAHQSTKRNVAPPQADAVEFASDYRVRCPICASMTYVKAAQAGHTVKCSDCYSPITVPQPPKIPKKHKIDLENAETFRLEEQPEAENRPADPFRKSAEELLEKAARVDEETPEPDFDAPSVKEWAKKVFGIFFDPGVMVHWLILSSIAAVPTFLILKLEVDFLKLAMFPGGLFLGASVVGCGFAILQSIANDEDSVSEWPIMDPLGWLGPLFVAGAAAGVAVIPAWMLGQMVFGTDLRTVGLTMLSIYILFPFVLLSMLDMQSAFVPFSAEVARSVTKSDEAWGGFYFSSGLIFFLLFLILALASTLAAPAGAVLSIFSTIAITFIYFGMIGRLAYSIGQAVNDAPMVNDIDRSVRSDAAEK